MVFGTMTMKTGVLILVFLLIEAAAAYKIPKSFESLIHSQSDDELTNPISTNEEKETPDLIEGDIMPDKTPQQDFDDADSQVSKRNAQRIRKYLWSGSTVPYEIDSTLAGNAQAVTAINDAVNEYHNRTCIKFVLKTDQSKWIKFVKKTGCWSYIGQQFSSTGAQEVSLGRGCYYKKTVIHELMHAIGFWHEQSRYDRDKYVEIYWENIIPDKDNNFVRHGNDVIDALGVIYDYKSIVHYQAHAFTRNGEVTMTALGDPTNSKNIGPGDALSDLDIVKIDRLYCKDSASLGLYEGGAIKEISFSASSYKDFYDLYTPKRARLHGVTGWCPNSENDEYLEVDIESVNSIRKIETQGNGIYNQWVTKYAIKYSLDKATWNTYTENGVEKVFAGNTDSSTVVENNLASAISARYVRIYPKEAHDLPCMRIDLFTEPTTKISPWSSWGPCDRQSCVKMRQRFCTSTNVLADCPSADDYGVDTQTMACTEAECNAPIDGHWNRWSSWSSCSKSCDVGTHTRTRTCTDPAPLSGGAPCSGSTSMSATCQLTPCNLVPEGCAFTTDYCKWTQDPAKDIYWYRKDYRTASSNTGPSGDHTSPDGSGYYIYLEASGVAVGSKAILRSADQTGTNSQMCLSFFYHMYGSGMGTLNVKLKKISTGQTITLATVSGDQGNQWLEKKVTFTSPENYVVLLEGIRGSDFRSDMALDDIGIHSGACT